MHNYIIMATLTFKYTDKYFVEHNREINEITLDVPDDMTTGEYKSVCRRLALALGYHPSNIATTFPDTPQE
jgi:hypothetical protein